MKLRRFMIATTVAGVLAVAGTATAAPPKSVRVPRPANEASTITLLGHTPWVTTHQRSGTRHFLWKVPSATVIPTKDQPYGAMIAAGGSLWTFDHDITYQRNASGKLVWSGRITAPDGVNAVSPLGGIVSGPGALYIPTVLGLFRIDTATRQVTQIGTDEIEVPAVAANGTVWGVQDGAEGFGALVFRPDGTTARFPLPPRDPAVGGEGAIASDGSYWFAWGSGVMRVGADGVVTILDPGHRYMAVVAAPDGSIWTGRLDGRVLRYAASGGTGRVRGRAPSGRAEGIVIDGRRVWVLHSSVTDGSGTVVKPAGVFTLTR